MASTAAAPSAPAASSHQPATNGPRAPSDAAVPSSRQERPRNRIQVSREKRPLNFFVGLAKKFLLNEDEVELSGLGLAVATVVTVAEILKNSGHVIITRIQTSLVDTQADGRGGIPKAKIQIWIKKSETFSNVMATDSVGGRAETAPPLALQSAMGSTNSAPNNAVTGGLDPQT